MAGFHQTRIYTMDDNPWCPRCLNGERVVGTKTLKDGAVVCWPASVPTKKGCKDFVERGENCTEPFTDIIGE